MANPRKERHGLRKIAAQLPILRMQVVACQGGEVALLLCFCFYIPPLRLLPSPSLQPWRGFRHAFHRALRALDSASRCARGFLTTCSLTLPQLRPSANLGAVMLPALLGKPCNPPVQLARPHSGMLQAYSFACFKVRPLASPPTPSKPQSKP